MELVNGLYQLEPKLSKAPMAEICEKLTLLLAPFAPYTSQELWETLGRSGPVFRQRWPAFDEELASEEEAEIPIQVNGKLRGRLRVAFGTSNDELRELAVAHEKVKPFTDGKQIAKVVIVPDKLVNIVVK
jgi:leucyl-tRNA synthetase